MRSAALILLGIVFGTGPALAQPDGGSGSFSGPGSGAQPPGSAGTVRASGDAAVPEQPRDPEGAEPSPEEELPSATTVITATRLPRPLRDVPSTVIVLPRAELERHPGLTLDAVARAVPSLATFRRSSSLVADPSSQGVNLRGVGPSGVSRALVLLDGLPVSDAFGGWMYWRAIPQLELERVEVAPGPGSSLYGSAALGGVIQLVSRRPTATGVEAELLAGSHWTTGAAVRATHRWDQGALSLDAEALRSDGFPVVSLAQAGPVDLAAPSAHAVVAGHLELTPRPWLSLRARAGFFEQAQNGGTRFTTAQVGVFDFSLTADASLAQRGQLVSAVYGRWSRFDQERARITDGRSQETLAARQAVPARELGTTVQYAAPPLAGHRLSAGAELRWVQGISLETVFPPSLEPSALIGRDSGGSQLLAGLHLQDELSLHRTLSLIASLRADGWSNFDGRRVQRRHLQPSTEEAFSTRSQGQLSPRLGILYRPVQPLALRASVGSAFRAPTLNELYRPFQVGTVLTAANPALAPERLWGGEAGVEVVPLGKLTLRLTGFWNALSDPVTNVTLPSPLADGSERQRQNLGAATIRGLEAWADYRPWRSLTFTLAHTWVDATVTDSPGRPDLLGKRLPQDPEHRFTGSVAFEHPRWFSATLQLRHLGAQFEDDLNQRALAGFTVVDLGLQRRLGRGLELFAAVENLLDRRYLVGRAGVDTMGAPRTVRLGLRLRPR